MTDNNHPITPPLELVKKWIEDRAGAQMKGIPSEVCMEIAAQAARWGADQELDECDKALRKIWQMDHVSTVDDFLRELRAARRPKPKSQAEEALTEIEEVEGAMYSAGIGCDFTATRAALERLRELEDGND